MKILIVGATSALAKEVIPVLAKEHGIITAGKKDCDIYCDVTKDVSVPKNTDIVINFAATFGGKTDEEIIGAQETNIRGALNVCIASKKVGSHIINISSIFTLLGENSPYYSIYSITKKHADELTQLYCGIHSIPLTIIRPSQIYGDNESFAKHQPFFYQIVDKAQKGEDVTIYGTHDAKRNYIHSADLAEIINRVVEKRVQGIFTCTYPSDATYAQIAQTAQKIFGNGGRVVFHNDKPNIPDNIFTYDQTLYEMINYFPAISIEDGIKRIKSYRERA